MLVPRCPGLYPGAHLLFLFSTELVYDVLRIYDGPVTSQPGLLASLSGNTMPPDVQSVGPSMMIVFTSDSSLSRAGFVAELSVASSSSTERVGMAAPPSSAMPSSMINPTLTNSGILSVPATPAPTSCIVCGCTANTPIQLGSQPVTISDGGGEHYANEMFCMWTVQSAAPITLTFTALSTEAGYDIVVVYEGIGIEGLALESYSGAPAPLPDPLRWSGSSMTIVFRSDSSIWDAGFTAYLTSTAEQPSASAGLASSVPVPGDGSTASTVIEAQPTMGCIANTPLQLDSTQPSISISDGPGDYSNELLCMWTVTATGPLMISFGGFATEIGYDFVSVYEGIGTGGIVQSFSGRDIPAPLTWGTSSITIVFRSDSSVRAAGFVATLSLSTSTPPNIAPAVASAPVSAVPGAMPPTERCAASTTLQLGSMPLMISDGPADYDNSLTCRWNVRVVDPYFTANMSVTLSFSSFSTEAQFDMLYVYDGLGTAVPLESLSGASLWSLPAPLTTSQPSMTIVFTSDSSVRGEGFVATISLASVTAPTVSDSPLPPYEFADVSGGGAARFVPQVDTTTTTAAPTAYPYSSPQYILGCSRNTTVQIDSTSPRMISDGEGHYSNGEHCLWLVHASAPITLSFSSFATEAGYDHVTVYDTDGTLLSHISGVQLPLPLMSNGTMMRIEFVADSSLAAAGFVAIVSTSGASSVSPTAAPIFHLMPTAPPTIQPSRVPSASPTVLPTTWPSDVPTLQPSSAPTLTPTFTPVSPHRSHATLSVEGSASSFDFNAFRLELAALLAIDAQRVSVVSSQSRRQASFSLEVMIDAAPSAVPSSVSLASPNTSSASPSSTIASDAAMALLADKTAQLSIKVIALVTVAPSAEVTAVPSVSPSVVPTIVPSNVPSASPTQLPSLSPSVVPTLSPSSAPTLSPSPNPSSVPTLRPTNSSAFSSLSPSVAPTLMPSSVPTSAPSSTPTGPPSVSPSILPSLAPSAVPSQSPSSAPSLVPTLPPSFYALFDSLTPSVAPTLTPTSVPTSGPSVLPSTAPSLSPTHPPTVVPSSIPTISPTFTPTAASSLSPTVLATLAPTGFDDWLSIEPGAEWLTLVPWSVPTINPTTNPTVAPAVGPTIAPTVMPTSIPLCSGKHKPPSHN